MPTDPKQRFPDNIDGPSSPAQSAPPVRRPEGRSLSAEVLEETPYTDAIGSAVCELLAQGRTLASVCKEHPEWPSARSFGRWALEEGHPFASQYARARLNGYHATAAGTLVVDDLREGGEITIRIVA